MSAFFGFCNKLQANTNVFGGNAFGAPASTPAVSGQQPTFGGSTGFAFGSTAPNAAPGFGGSAFGGFGAPTTSSGTFGGFGATAQSAQPQSSFFSGLSQPAQPSGGFFSGTQTTGGTFFGAQPTQPNVFGAQPAPGGPMSEAEYAARLATCIQSPFIFGDDRDPIIAKYNSVLATIGCGKAFHSQGQTLEIAPDNAFCKWKCVVYMPKRDPGSNEGVIRMIFNKTDTEVYEVRRELAELLHKLLGDLPNVQVEIDGVAPLPDNKCELLFHVLERQNDGNIRRTPASELFSFLMQPAQRAHLQSMLVEDVQAKVAHTKEMEKQYLEKVPPGLSSYMWYQAQKDNPDPENLFPVPIVGFNEMYDQLKKEHALAALCKEKSTLIENDLRQLESKAETNKQLSSSYRDKLDKFVLRQLRIASNQPTIARIGQPLSKFETDLFDQVSQMKASMEAPERNLKNRAQELATNIQLHDRYLTERAKRQPRIDTRSLSETEKDDMAKACDLLFNVLDACKERIKEEKDMLLKLLSEESDSMSVN
ncbi:nuclear pore complex protein Nup54-like [Paramacrobiotus metropolitanus]|uniref:nuclear pore complex protein Nup54-like n=1 Tax=Paramacrobiotus metropolitanus TaxID=2943436 RepID=UPI0024460FE1|nr:nuclear pore complex protein Nup54-like [Paramacrobiotus metropolitanus]